MEWNPISSFFLFFATILVVHCGENGLWLRASCKLFCIEKESLEDHRKNLISCSSEKCIKCWQSCSLDINQPCSTQCSNTTSLRETCLESCTFLKRRYNQEKPGKCSSVRRGFELAEVARCTNDNGCQGPEKCCSNEKLKTCQVPRYVFDSSYPPVPIRVRVKKISSSLLVSWQFPFNSTWKKATIFVIEKRQSSRLLRPSNSDYSLWKFAGETTAMEIVLKDLLPGDWYQMRVMAYSMNGTNGYSHRSRSIRMNFEIRRPSPPRNITALGAWFHNSKIFVKISWSPPLLLDRPVRRYRIIYYKHVDGTEEHYFTVPVKTKKIPGKETSTILTDLEPNSVYVVKIQAMLTVRRGKRIKGRWDVLYLKTPPIEITTLQKPKNPIITTKSFSPTATSNISVKLKCIRVFFSKYGVLSAVIKWRVPDIVVGIQFDYFPEKCKKKVKNRDKKTILLNARKNETTLVDLYENCHYLVKMKTYFSNNSEAPFQKSLNVSTYPKVKTLPHPTAMSIHKLHSNGSSRLEYSFFVFIFSFLVLSYNLAVDDIL